MPEQTWAVTGVIRHLGSRTMWQSQPLFLPADTSTADLLTSQSYHHHAVHGVDCSGVQVF